MHFSRRQLLGMLGSSLATLPPFTRALAQPTNLRTREDVAVFARDPLQVEALRLAVGEMKAESERSAHSPLGWEYWAAIHGTTLRQGQIPDELRNIYGTCTHSPRGFVEPHFVSWHRAYLYFFEIVLAWTAEQMGARAPLSLPYWNWYGQPRMPSIFTEGSAANNPLFHARQRTDLSEIFIVDTWLSETTFMPDFESGADGFTLALEIRPHGEIHDLIGGDMGSTLTAARDPVFWLHHTNIDRLWTVWLNQGNNRSNPNDADWLSRSWPFTAADAGGGGQDQWRLSASQVLDSGALGYRYDNETTTVSLEVAEAAAARIRLAQRQTGTVTFSAGRNVQLAGAVTLGNNTVSVGVAPPAQVPFSTGRQRANPPIGAGHGQHGVPSGPSILLEDVEIDPQGRAGGFSYRVKAVYTPPGGGRPVEVDLGNIGTFSLGVDKHGSAIHAGTPEDGRRISVRLPLKGELARLANTQSATLARDLRVTFAPVHAPRGGANVSYVKVGNVRIDPAGR
jgi:tyrosinase